MARYHDIAESLRAAIADGVYRRGAQLPGERELSLQYGVAAGTIRQALGELVNEGVLASRQGSRRVIIDTPKKRGTFEEFRSFAQWAWSKGKTPTGRVVSAQWKTASEEDRENLRLVSGDLIYRVQRVRGVDGSPIMVERTRYSAAVGVHAEKIPDDCPSVTAWLADEAGINFARAEHQFSACAAGVEDAALLQVRRGAPLLTHRRISYSRDGTPLEWAEDRYVAGGLKLAVDNSAAANVLRWA